MNCQPMGVPPRYRHSGGGGGQIPQFWPKMTPNIGINNMQITSQFGPLDDAE